ncbi:MAG: glycosyltransferase [Methanobrevibacter sp.]|uniref:glycosyltransferase family 2 protein n=1 Tax=Methanobrevibacter sp. TaxID=66852 RepID=UPI0025EE1BA4|nr:glycosyltransferase [Methanobrevibacter sp.]MBQ8018713.1 glycosyltransferase [Methanobrevibacter sp.]
MKISVIVPVYNVEAYLQQCLDSILYQSLRDIEVICINDGSTDSSLEILEEYQKKDSRVKIFAQSNRGLANARNRGLEKAKGEYVIFIDSDDYFVRDAFEMLYKASQENQADFTLFKLLNFDDKTGETSPINYFDMPFLKRFDGEVFSHHDVGERLFNISVTAPGKLFKREFIGNLRFPEDLLFEDTPFVLETIFKAQKMYFIDEYLYMRRIHKDSITQSRYSRFSDCIIIFNMMADITRKYGEYEMYKEKLFSQKSANTYTRFMQVDEEYKSDFYDKIKKDFTSKRAEFENTLDFNKVKPRSRHIFYCALNSNDYHDFIELVESFNNKTGISLFSRVFKKLLKKI